MKKTLAALVFAASLPLTVSAAGLSYSYIEAGYSKVDTGLQLGILGFSGGQGYQIDGAYALGAHWFVEGDYRYNSFRQYQALTKSTSSVDLTPQSLRLGGGYHTPLGDSVDLVAHLDYGAARSELTQSQPHSSTSDDHSGYVVGLGFRVPTDVVEFELGLDHDDLGLGRVVAVCTGKCAVFIPEIRQDGAETVFSAALRHDFGPVTAGVGYQRSSYQGWRDLLVSLRIIF